MPVLLSPKLSMCGVPRESGNCAIEAEFVAHEPSEDAECGGCVAESVGELSACAEFAMRVPGERNPAESSGANEPNVLRGIVSGAGRLYCSGDARPMPAKD